LYSSIQRFVWSTRIVGRPQINFGVCHFEECQNPTSKKARASQYFNAYCPSHDQLMRRAKITRPLRRYVRNRPGGRFGLHLESFGLSVLNYDEMVREQG